MTLVLTIALGSVVVGIASYTTTSLRYGRTVQDRTDRLAASDAGMRIALERLRTKVPGCTTSPTTYYTTTVNNKSVNGNALIFAGTAPAGCTVPGLNGLGLITVNNLITAANSASNYSLAAYPNTTASGPARSCQEFMKTALDRANNNLNFLVPCN